MAHQRTRARVVPCPGLPTHLLTHCHITQTEGKPVCGWPSHLMKKMHRQDTAGCKGGARLDVQTMHNQMLCGTTQMVGSPAPRITGVPAVSGCSGVSEQRSPGAGSLCGEGRVPISSSLCSMGVAKSINVTSDRPGYKSSHVILGA